MKPLVILELANNHMGDVAHGCQTIRVFDTICDKYRTLFDFAFKLQYRDLDTFIHPAYRGREDIKYVKRFEETRLSDREFRQLLATMKDTGFGTVCTPFDEASVGRIVAHGIETVKIASCSFGDWPLMECIATTDKPIIATTAAATLDEIDSVVSFFLHRNKNLTLMHCVAEYPTPDASLQLNQIELLRQRYPDCRIGFSTHESPSNTSAVALALAKGALVLEKHVVLPTEKYQANAYSVSPMQLDQWLHAAAAAWGMCGATIRYVPSVGERSSLLTLRRGVFATRGVAAGDELDTSSVSFAFPPVEGQLTANDWSKYSRFIAQIPISAGEPVMLANLAHVHLRGHVLNAVDAVRSLLRAAKVVVPGKAELEVSHHYGMERFAEFGLTLINVVNREYCKKLLVMLPGQMHPEQYHEKKEETFVMLHGDLTLWLDDVVQQAQVGDVITVPRGVRHKFRTNTGCVFEEISSTHFSDDSYYTDPAISANRKRKTLLAHWM